MQTQFEYVNYGIETQGGAPVLPNFKRIIRMGWMAPTRREIDVIRSCPEFTGTIVAVEMKQGLRPPTLGGYTDALVRKGWGLFHYDASTAYYGRIVSDRRSDGYHYKGRKGVNPTNSDRQTDNLRIDVQNKYQCRELCNDLTEIWERDVLSSISAVDVDYSDDSGYVITTDENALTTRADTQSGWIGDPTVPTERSIDRLLTRGWGVTAIKKNKLYVSKLQPVISEDVSYSFEVVEGSDHLQYYTPRACDNCGVREFEYDYTSTEGDVTAELCRYCLDEVEPNNSSRDDNSI